MAATPRPPVGGVGRPIGRRTIVLSRRAARVRLLVRPVNRGTTGTAASPASPAKHANRVSLVASVNRGVSVNRVANASCGRNASRVANASPEESGRVASPESAGMIASRGSPASRVSIANPANRGSRATVIRHRDRTMTATKGRGERLPARTWGVRGVAVPRGGVLKGAVLRVAVRKGAGVVMVAVTRGDLRRIGEGVIGRPAMRFAGAPRCGPKPRVGGASPRRERTVVRGVARGRTTAGEERTTGEMMGMEVVGDGVGGVHVGVDRLPCRGAGWEVAECRVAGWVGGDRGADRAGACLRCPRRRGVGVAGGDARGVRHRVAINPECRREGVTTSPTTRPTMTRCPPRELWRGCWRCTPRAMGS